MAEIKLFSTSIYETKCLSQTSSLFKSLTKEASQIESFDEVGGSWSSKNYANGFTSYASMDELHLFSPHFAELKKYLDKHVIKYIKILNLDVGPNEVQLSKIWLNIMNKNTIHTMHIHPYSVISGTFYLQTPPNCSVIKFEDPRMGFFMNRPPVKSIKNKDDQKLFYSLKPKAGNVVLFESWLRHEVPLHEANKPRISVSFNYDWVAKK